MIPDSSVLRRVSSLILSRPPSHIEERYTARRVRVGSPILYTRTVTKLASKVPGCGYWAGTLSILQQQAAQRPGSAD